jgi:hypothetical protein
MNLLLHAFSCKSIYFLKNLFENYSIISLKSFANF